MMLPTNWHQSRASRTRATSAPAGNCQLRHYGASEMEEFVDPIRPAQYGGGRMSADRITVQRWTGKKGSPTLSQFNTVQLVCQDCCLCGAEPTHLGIRHFTPEEMRFYNAPWYGYALCRRCHDDPEVSAKVEALLTSEFLEHHARRTSQTQ